jgi:type I restriction enzyme M protein
MYGAIIGDVAGSYPEVLEMNAKKDKIKRSVMERKLIMDKSVPLFNENSSCTDDSVLTCAIADAILNGKDYGTTLKEYGLREVDMDKDLYGRSRFGKSFTEWITGDYIGDSYGNGSAMRISPVAFLFDDLDKIKEQSYKATMPSHNHPESLQAAEAVAVAIYMLNCKISKEEIRKYIERHYFSLKFNLDDLREDYIFTSKATGSVPQAIYCFLISNDFEDAIRKAISIGGDTDTIAAITGSLAEAYYGVPEYLIEAVKPYFKDYMFPVIDKFYNKEKSKVYEKCNRDFNKK